VTIRMRIKVEIKVPHWWDEQDVQDHVEQLFREAGYELADISTAPADVEAPVVHFTPELDVA